MTLQDLKNKKITIMGLGLHGGAVGVVRFLHSLEAKIVVTDLKSKEVLSSSLEKLKGLKNIEYVLGQHRPEDFVKTELVIKNPAVSWNNKYIKLALENKVSVEMDSSLFFKLCKNHIIGVTGTKGKTTVSLLIHSILKMAGKNSIKAGIGQFSVLDKLTELKKDSIVVFELSSWRLSALGRNSIGPCGAVITNIFPDHLNYYSSMENYVRDKKNIFLHQKAEDYCIVNWDNEGTRLFENEVKSQLIKCSKERITGKGVYASNGSIFINDGIEEKKVMEVAEVALLGVHNLENVLLAVGAAWMEKIRLSDIRKAVMDFKGVAYRLELIRELDGVKYYNDTAATTPESAIAGINSFHAPPVIICGGSDKNLDMKEMARVIDEKVSRAVFLKGEATDKIISALKSFAKKRDSDRKYIIADSLQEAVDQARSVAQNGDAVLFSPGAASFNMFANEFDRGDKFNEAVKGLK